MSSWGWTFRLRGLLLCLRVVPVKQALIISDNLVEKMIALSKVSYRSYLLMWRHCCFWSGVRIRCTNVHDTLQRNAWQSQKSESIGIPHNQFPSHQKGHEWFDIDPYEPPLCLLSSTNIQPALNWTCLSNTNVQLMVSSPNTCVSSPIFLAHFFFYLHKICASLMFLPWIHHKNSRFASATTYFCIIHYNWLLSRWQYQSWVFEHLGYHFVDTFYKLLTPCELCLFLRGF